MVKHDKTDNEQPINKEEIKKYKDWKHQIKYLLDCQFL